MKIRLRVYNLRDFPKLVSGMILPNHIPNQKFSLNKKSLSRDKKQLKKKKISRQVFHWSFELSLLTLVPRSGSSRKQTIPTKADDPEA